LELDCPPDIHINSFKDSIYKVVSNLVENAILHAFPSGAVGTMRISIKSTEEKIILKFSDDGMGIPAEHLPKIFDPFFTTSSGTAGSGLGLSIVFNLVTNKLHGKISCTSAVSEGTIFHIEFPIVET
jgi:signal transduction histidine kinase